MSTSRRGRLARRDSWEWSYAIVPAAALAVAWLAGWLRPDPIGAAIRWAGRVALVSLLASLAVSPLSRLGVLRQVARHRRALGLAAFGYAVVHLVLYAVVDYRLDLPLLARSIAGSPFVLAGLGSLALMVPLAATSFGRRNARQWARWRQLHRLVYAAGGLAVLHYVWRFKELRLLPILAGLVLVMLMVARVLFWARQMAASR